MNITVERAQTEEALERIFKIREKVFVLEQEVAPEEEYDDFDQESIHFLARLDGQPAGTARWRFTSRGVKLERFAVLKSMRGKGIGQALVQAVLEDIQKEASVQGKKCYLHAQLPAVALYEKFGFQRVGDIFKECNIEHYKMERLL